MRQVTSEDVLHFGMIPEFVGRLAGDLGPTPLDEDGLIQVLTEPKNALIKQYQTLFEMENCRWSSPKVPCTPSPAERSQKAPAPAACGRSSRR